MPHIVVFDSGLGGLSVFKEIRKARPGDDITYVADTGGFPYGALTEQDVVRRVLATFAAVVAHRPPDIAVIACNTASTLVLPFLRASHDFPFVGTVPAVKPAAEQTETGLISVLATPGTVKRDYTQALIATYAQDVDVTLVGATRLAALAETTMRGESVDRTALIAEIAPAFVERKGARTDTVVLACTHYPLLLEHLRAHAPWPVTWIDPAPAIARRVSTLLEKSPGPDTGDTAGSAPRPALAAIVTAPADERSSLTEILGRFGIGAPTVLALPEAARRTG